MDFPSFFFETPRLSVRPFTPADLDAFAALMADPEVCRFPGDGTTLPRSEVERWIGICHEKYAARGFGTSAVFERATGAFVGYCGVVRAPGNDFDELVYAFAQAAWGKGYATEVGAAMLAHVFRLGDLGRVWATIAPENGRTKRVLAKLGFRYDRTLTDAEGTTEFHVLDRPAPGLGKLVGGAAVLLSADVERAAAYYRDQLGFAIDSLYGNPAYFGIVERDGCWVNLALAPSEHIVPHYRVVPGTWNVYFWVDDAEAVYAEVKRRGATIDYELGTKPYGVKEFGVRDADGYDVAFGQIVQPLKGSR